MKHPAETSRRKPFCAVRLVRWMLALLPVIVACSSDSSYVSTVQVVDAASNAPIRGAVVMVPDHLALTDDKGMVLLAKPVSQLWVRAPGHGRIELNNIDKDRSNLVVRLPAVTPKALYLSVYGAGNERLLGNALKLLSETELNALVMDVKGDRGYIPYRSAVALAAKIGAQRVITVRNMPGLIASLRARGIYTVARVVTFKDDPLARARPEWAVHTRGGELWRDREGLAWGDPFRPEVWNYNIDIAEEAARMGFDEIQFDYVRFPDEPGLAFSSSSTQQNRVAAVTGFLSAAAKRLAPYNVFVSADVFGYVLWNRNDTSIGQRLEDMVPQLDYISPMLYPSAFQFGIPGYSNPVAHPYETVNLSLMNAQKRTGLPARHIRPWLQAFHDYAFDHRHFGARQITDQIKAAEDFGSDGWMLWNPRNVYSAEGLKKKNGNDAARRQ